jgi:uncharacterized membrane protein|nr:hypothetical protein [uncultured Methanoregula sp.]
MKPERITAILITCLRFTLLGILSLMTAAFLFVFIINWEDWFFGTKLAGLPAGMYLFAKAALAIIIIYLILRYPQEIKYTAIPALCFLCWIFLDSSWTFQKTSGGRMLFSPVLGIFFVVPLVLYCSWVLAATRKGS